MRHDARLREAIDFVDTARHTVRRRSALGDRWRFALVKIKYKWHEYKFHMI